jgi:hypothetical protein
MAVIPEVFPKNNDQKQLAICLSIKLCFYQLTISMH